MNRAPVVRPETARVLLEVSERSNRLRTARASSLGAGLAFALTSSQGADLLLDELELVNRGAAPEDWTFRAKALAQELGFLHKCETLPEWKALLVACASMTYWIRKGNNPWRLRTIDATSR